MRLLKALVFIDTQISRLNMWNDWVYFRNEVKSRRVQPAATLVSTAIWDRGYICIGRQDSQWASSSPGREAEAPGSAAKYPTPGYKPCGLPSTGKRCPEPHIQCNHNQRSVCGNARQASTAPQLRASSAWVTATVTPMRPSRHVKAPLNFWFVYRFRKRRGSLLRSGCR